MSGNVSKALSHALGYGCGILNVPVTQAFDNDTQTVIPSPVTSGAGSAELVVPPSGYRFNCVSENQMEVIMVKNGSQLGGTLRLPGDQIHSFEVAGMGDRPGLYPDAIRLTSFSADAYFWFDCENPGGA